MLKRTCVECDICSNSEKIEGLFASDHPRDWVQGTITIAGYRFHDLCPECHLEFEKFLAERFMK